ncbi:6788_t:CDS:1 [Dentiscutata erythropus]|uniref:6788_t:CDS:1 n=1 Tax=Dentiscutata erythropus TaxID=1348616 RepID=A0A9N9E8U6_9GLOM|nr:6788_t:CDS:1 [Dentiscutata erythropus]
MGFLKLNNSFLPCYPSKRQIFCKSNLLLEYCDYVKVSEYDLHCTSFDRLIYLRLCCPKCKMYFPTLTFLTNHKQLKHFANRSRKPKRLFKQNSLDDCSVFSIYEVQVQIVLEEKKYMSDQN